MTCWSAIRDAPWARVTVVIMGRNSGVSPTASATAKSRDSKAGRCIARLAASSTSTSTRTVRVMRSPKCRRPRSNSVSGARVDSRAMTSPNAVAAPVAVTTAVAWPLTIGGPEPDGARRIALHPGRHLLHGQGLAGQRRLVNVQVARLEQPAVRGDQIPGREANEVTGHDRPARQLGPLSVALHRGRGRHLLAELLRRLLRAPRLQQVDGDAEDHHPGDERGVDHLAQSRRQRCRHEQHERQGVSEQRQQLRQGRYRLRAGGSFGPERARRASASSEVSPRELVGSMATPSYAPPTARHGHEGD